MSLETALWLGALAAAGQRIPAHLNGDLAKLATEMLRRRRARAKA